MSNTTVRFMQGNDALVEGAIVAGARFFAGYPITPASEITEGMSVRLPLVGGVFLQMEDEIASMGAAIGASMAGAKCLTSTAGPGFSLKQEGIGIASMMEIPVVIVDVMRGGPASGMSTLPSQMDVMQARWGCHGDHPIIVLSPATVTECYELAIKAFNLAELVRQPVIILSDAIVGHLRERIDLPDPSTVKIINRKMTTKSPDEYAPFEADEDGVPCFAERGTAYRYHMCSNVHTEKGFPADTNNAVAAKLLTRLRKKLENYEDEITTYKFFGAEDYDTLIVAYGCVTRAAKDAANAMNAEGGKVGVLQLQSLWPFPKKVVAEYAEKANKVLMPEMNLGQLIDQVRLATNKPVEGLNRFDGAEITPQQIIEKVREM